MGRGKERLQEAGKRVIQENRMLKNGNGSGFFLGKLRSSPRRVSSMNVTPEDLDDSKTNQALKGKKERGGGLVLFGSLVGFVFSFMLFVVVMLLIGGSLTSGFPAPDEAPVGTEKNPTSLSGSFVALFEGMLTADAAQARATVNDLVKGVCALFAITIQITAILLQIAAREFSGDVSKLFAKDRVLVISNVFFTLVFCYIIFLTTCISDDYVPRGEIFIAAVLMIFDVLYIIPYFIYVLRMVDPLKVVNNVSKDGLRACQFRSSVQNSTASLVTSQNEALWAIESIAQIALNAMQSQNKTLAYSCVEVMCQFTVRYGVLKGSWRTKQEVQERGDGGASWFSLPAEHRNSPDYFSLSDEAIDDLEERRTWVEYKVLRQYQNMFQDALTTMCDLCYVIAVNTRQIAEAASARHDFMTWDLCTKFFNTFVRYGLVKSDTKTVYNILHQYRSVAETLISQDLERLSVVRTKKKKMQSNGTVFRTVADLAKVKGNFVVNESKDIVLAAESRLLGLVNYLSYYADAALQHGMAFIAETIAHDIGTITAKAYLAKRECHSEMLDIFLNVQQLATDLNQEHGLLGMRRAQVKLATTYLMHEARRFAGLVQTSMKEEDRSFVLRIWSDLESVNEREFWEVNDRGINIDYLPEPQRAKLEEFFAMFGLNRNDLLEEQRSIRGTGGGDAPLHLQSFDMGGVRKASHAPVGGGGPSDGGGGGGGGGAQPASTRRSRVSGVNQMAAHSKHAAGGVRQRNTILHPGRRKQVSIVATTIAEETTMELEELSDSIPELDSVEVEESRGPESANRGGSKRSSVKNKKLT